jgi:predicted porin
MSSQNGTSAGQTWTRRSTVSLFSQAGGEVRLGRDYTPTFWNLAYFDVYGANGLGNDTNLISLTNPVGSTSTTGVRADNSVGYHLPGNLGGFYGQAMIAAGQGNDNNKYWGLRGGFATGPFDAAVAYGVTDVNPVSDLKVTNLGVSWNFGFMKLFGVWNDQKFANLKEDYWGISVGVPLGQGEFRAGYGSVDDKGTQGALNINNADATIWSLQYIYNLSKRTALYGGYAQISNDPGSARSILPGTAAIGLLGNDSKGYNIGVRHSF